MKEIAAFLLLVFLSGCVYRLDIQQGNVIDRQKLEQVQIGMSKRQVRYLLGTPLIVDTFNPDRWDYYFSLKAYKPKESEGQFFQERLTLFFENGQLSRMEKQLIEKQPEHTTNKEVEEVVKPQEAEDEQ